MSRKYKMYDGSLVVEQVAEGISVTIQNADSLIAEARILFNAGRYARAAALAILAEEETGKIALLAGSVTNAHDQKTWKHFWTRFRSHNSKYRDTMLMD